MQNANQAKLLLPVIKLEDCEILYSCLLIRSSLNLVVQSLDRIRERFGLFGIDWYLCPQPKQKKDTDYKVFRKLGSR